MNEWLEWLILTNICNQHVVLALYLKGITSWPPLYSYSPLYLLTASPALYFSIPLLSPPLFLCPPVQNIHFLSVFPQHDSARCCTQLVDDKESQILSCKIHHTSLLMIICTHTAEKHTNPLVLECLTLWQNLLWNIMCNQDIAKQEKQQTDSVSVWEQQEGQGCVKVIQ